MPWMKKKEKELLIRFLIGLLYIGNFFSSFLWHLLSHLLIFLFFFIFSISIIFLQLLAIFNKNTFVKKIIFIIIIRLIFFKQCIFLKNNETLIIYSILFNHNVSSGPTCVWCFGCVLCWKPTLYARSFIFYYFGKICYFWIWSIFHPHSSHIFANIFATPSVTNHVPIIYVTYW